LALSRERTPLADSVETLRCQYRSGPEREPVGRAKAWERSGERRLPDGSEGEGPREDENQEGNGLKRLP